MVVNQEFINSQKRNDSGFIVEIKAETDAQKAIFEELRSFKTHIKNSKLSLSKDFYDQANGAYNFAILNKESFESFSKKLIKLEEEALNGEYALDSKTQNNNPKKNSYKRQETPEKNTSENKKYEPALNDKGFVVVFKPKTETQELISEQFDAFYERYIKDKGLSKEFINSFNNSRNYFVGQEISQNKIDEFFEKTEKRIAKGDGLKKENDQSLAQLLERVGKLEHQMATLMRKGNFKTEAHDSDSHNDENSLDFNVVAKKIEAMRKSMMNKGYTKDDYKELQGLKNIIYESEEHLDKTLSEFKEKIGERLAQRQTQANEKANENNQAQEDKEAQEDKQENSQNIQSPVLQRYMSQNSPSSERDFDPNDDTALNELRTEAKEFRKEKMNLAQQSYSQRISG